MKNLILIPYLTVVLSMYIMLLSIEKVIHNNFFISSMVKTNLILKKPSG